MNAGRDLDKLIAEKVMGYIWRVVPPDAHGENAGRTLVPATFTPTMGWLPPLGPIHEAWMVPNYSTVLADAFELVNASNAFFELFNNPRKKTWSAKFMGQDEWITADSAPLAICLAALKGIGEEAR